MLLLLGHEERMLGLWRRVERALERHRGGVSPLKGALPRSWAALCDYPGNERRGRWLALLAGVLGVPLGGNSWQLAALPGLWFGLLWAWGEQGWPKRPWRA